jgi:hypothetical protein
MKIEAKHREILATLQFPELRTIPIEKGSERKVENT